MKQYVTIDKRSKKAQKEYYAKRRRTWGNLNPVTRSVPSGKTYNRNKDKQERRRIGREFSDGFDADFLFHRKDHVTLKCKSDELSYETKTHREDCTACTDAQLTRAEQKLC